MDIDKSGIENRWTTMFNGTDLTGWTPKISGRVYGDNYLNTFQVIDSAITVSYEAYDTFSGEFGHLFYETPYDSYHMKLEYRFLGDQVKGGPGWAYRNNGIMFHCQDPETMELNQDFPLSAEFQFLGGNGEVERSTGNLCTPGCHVTIDDELVTAHCINSSSSTYHGDGWVSAELIVQSNGIIHHVIEGDTVMTYSNLHMGGDHLPDKFKNREGSSMVSGYIALQAETTPTAFRNIMIKEL